MNIDQANIVQEFDNVKLSDYFVGPSDYKALMTAGITLAMILLTGGLIVATCLTLASAL